MKRINISISKKGSIERAIKELEAYKTRLNDKCNLFVERLALIGIPVIHEKYMQAETEDFDFDRSHYAYIKIQSFGDHHKAILTVEGKSLYFVEFGAGIHFNGHPNDSPNPSVEWDVPGGTLTHIGGQEHGFTIGSYGYHQGLKEYWFYYDDKGGSQMSKGTRASMPMFSAEMEIISQIEKIAKEVFYG
jgi:hypothetical protein